MTILIPIKARFAIKQWYTSFSIKMAHFNQNLIKIKLFLIQIVLFFMKMGLVFIKRLKHVNLIKNQSYSTKLVRFWEQSIKNGQFQQFQWLFKSILLQYSRFGRQNWIGFLIKIQFRFDLEGLKARAK